MVRYFSKWWDTNLLNVHYLTWEQYNHFSNTLYHYKMSAFTNFSSVQLPTRESKSYTLLEDLVYERQYKWSELYIVAPKGSKTDFASLPWIVTIFWKKDDPRWIKSSILHDFLWSKAKTIKDYQDANDIFYESMQVEGSPRWIAICFYLAVSLSKYPYFFYKNFISSKIWV